MFSLFEKSRYRKHIIQVSRCEPTRIACTWPTTVVVIYACYGSYLKSGDLLSVTPLVPIHIGFGEGGERTKHPHLNADWFIAKPVKRRESLGLDHEARRRRWLAGGSGVECPPPSCSAALSPWGRNFPSECEGEASRGSGGATIAVLGLLSLLLEPILCLFRRSFLVEGT